ncbi:MAG: nitrous oxide reductase family maturation protein NosD, partial [Hyphomicrobiaceae bacterium]|nr:nitrous oxide reductase family maturation protein NosD [Hyphomicrobiaceae bacterium]
MKLSLSLALALSLAALPAWAERIAVPAEPGALAAALAQAGEGDDLILAPGRHAGPVLIDRPLTLHGEPGAQIDAAGHGSVVTVDAKDVTIRGLTITGSGRSHETIDSGVKLTKRAT